MRKYLLPVVAPRIIAKLILVIFWLTASLATLALGIALTWARVNHPKLNLQQGFATPTSTYSLFAALPKRGSVLGQAIGVGDARSVRLYKYLLRFNSPLANYAQTLVTTADRYELPWALIPAIAGKESGYCRVIPHNSYNCWGWAVYTGQNSGAAWKNYNEAIETVAKGLREDYFNQGYKTIEEIEQIYTPQSAQRDHSWANDVSAIMQEIQGGS